MCKRMMMLVLAGVIVTMVAAGNAMAQDVVYESYTCVDGHHHHHHDHDHDHDHGYVSAYSSTTWTSGPVFYSNQPTYTSYSTWGSPVWTTCRTVEPAPTYIYGRPYPGTIVRTYYW